MEKDIVYYYEFPIQSTIDKTQNKQNKNKTTQTVYLSPHSVDIINEKQYYFALTLFIAAYIIFYI
jgi:hypothetical protein